MLLRLFAVIIPIILLAGCSSETNESFTEYAPYNRSEVSGSSGAVVSGHPLASAAGYDVLRRGGNATDAAVTMAAVLAVVRPHMNGLGGDAFALFYDPGSKQVMALNGSGRSGERATPDFFEAAGFETMPQTGAPAVTVPGALSAWQAALDRYGTITLSEALQPAISYAEEGFPVTPTLVRDLTPLIDDLNDAGRQIFGRNGNPPKMGELLKNPALAQSLKNIAQNGPSAFYGGPIGEAIVEFISEQGGHLSLNDFVNHTATWNESLTGNYLSKTVHVHPPNSQGITLLFQLGMMEHLPADTLSHNSSRYLSILTRLTAFSFADRDRWIADPELSPAPLSQLLDEEYLRERADEALQTMPSDAVHGFGNILDEDAADGDGDTVYLMAVDRDGNAVSWIQSLFSSFGSKLVEPESGVVLQNRGGGFTLQEGHPNRIAPGKRPFHTLTPVMVTDREGNLEMTLGTPGGHGQTQSQLQVLNNIYRFGMHPQQAVEAPRYRYLNENRIAIENRIPVQVRDELRNQGFDLTVSDGWTPLFGGFQLIHINNETGVLRTGADPRREAHAIAY
jgi:gamma-glutamyltranspeptidase / glutathione hydrolase